MLGLSLAAAGKVMVQFPALLSSPGTFPVGCGQDTFPHSILPSQDPASPARGQFWHRQLSLKLLAQDGSMDKSGSHY